MTTSVVRTPGALPNLGPDESPVHTIDHRSYVCHRRPCVSARYGTRLSHMWMKRTRERYGSRTPASLNESDTRDIWFEKVHAHVHGRCSLTHKSKIAVENVTTSWPEHVVPQVYLKSPWKFLKGTFAHYFKRQFVQSSLRKEAVIAAM